MTARHRRTAWATAALALTMLLTAALPAAAWSRWFKVNDGNATSGWADNDLTAAVGPYLHVAFDSISLAYGWMMYSRFDETEGAVDVRRFITDDCDTAQGLDADGDLVVLVCTHLQSPNLLLYRSTNAGVDWTGPLKLAQGVSEWDAASVAVSGQTVLVVWTDKAGRIKVRRSADGGASFAGATQLGATTARGLDNHRSGAVKVDAAGGAVYVAWMLKEAGRPTYAHQGLALRRSTDLGVTWRRTKVLTQGKLLDMGAALAATPTGVLVGYSTVGGDLRLLRSTDQGASFTSRVLTKRSHDLVDIATAGTEAAVIWASNAPRSRLKVNIRRSTDGGRTWAAARSTGITWGPDSSPWANVDLLAGSPVVLAVGADRTASNWLGSSLYASRP